MTPDFWAKVKRMDREMIVRRARRNQIRRQKEEAAAVAVRVGSVESAVRSVAINLRSAFIGLVLGLLAIAGAFAWDSRSKAASQAQINATLTHFMETTRRRQDRAAAHIQALEKAKK